MSANQQDMIQMQPNPFQETATHIAKHLAKDAIWSSQGGCNWQGNTLEPMDGQYVLVNRTFKSDVYHGLSGIALFLAQIQTKTADPIIQITLEGAVKTLMDQLKETPLGCKLGLYAGQLGVGFALWRVGLLNNNPTWRQQGLELVLSLSQDDISDHEIDVISGAAGAIPALLVMYRTEQHPGLLGFAKKCGDFLKKTAHKSDQHWSWHTFGEQALTGYSHGNAGIALALLELFQYTQDPNDFQAAAMGFNFERLHFMPNLNNWPDLRKSTEEQNNSPGCGHMWCHGAPGIALSRLRAYQLTQRHDFLQEAHTALNSTYQQVAQQIQQPQSDNFSICHGLAGNADILLTAGVLLNNTSYLELAQHVGNVGIQMYDATNTSWPSGVNDPSGQTAGGQETPGLMLGLAGTGYFYLRLADPTAVNSVLLIQ